MANSLRSRSALAERQRRFHDHAARVGAQLPGWVCFREKGLSARLAADDRMLRMALEIMDGERHVTVEGVVPEGLDDRAAGEHHISVPLHEPPESVAEQVRRRLLPRYTAAVRGAQALRDHERALRSERADLLGRLVDAAGPFTASDLDRRVYFGRSEEPFSGNAEIDPLLDAVTITVSVPVDRAVPFVASIEQLRRSSEAP